VNLCLAGRESPGEGPLRLLIAGGAGYVGSVVAARLEEAGHDLTVCDDLATGNAWAVPSGARFVPAELTERKSLDRVMAPGYDAVLYVAEPTSLSRIRGEPVA
jgi:UDP-glucose 4-epimerase